MSKRDTYHDIVKQALINEGWTISHDPYFFQTDPKLSADLGAERLLTAERKSEKIVVEIKSFLQSSQVVELEKAIGQYSLYQLFLRQKKEQRQLYLAVPRHAFSGIFSREVGRVAVENLNINLITIPSPLSSHFLIMYRPQNRKLFKQRLN